MRNPRCSSLLYTSIEAPIVGQLWLATTEEGLCTIAFDGEEQAFVERLDRRWGVRPQRDDAALTQAARQVHDYLAGRRRAFDLPLDLRCLRPFQHRVLEETMATPWGQTTTYQALALKIGRPRSMRAVGRAEATNPLPLVIPCHRVIGSDGKLRGYGGGIEVKSALLRLEGIALL